MLFVHVTIVMLNVWFLFTCLFIPFFSVVLFRNVSENSNKVLVKRLTVTTQIWIMTRHQYGISALFPQTSFRGETSGGVTNIGCLLRLTFSWKMYCPLGINKVRNHVGTMFY